MAASSNASVAETLNSFFRSVESLQLESVAPFFEEDAQMFSPLGAFPARLDGRAAIMAQFKAIADFVRQAPEPLKIEPRDLNIREHGDVALITFHLQPNAGPLHRRTFMMRRGASGWRIAHIHASIASTTM
ncbi:MAG: nuclear transport factor 2 family protein [Candidatus Binatus sp.]|uniref:nuclear transport factor 2 family protein n=1 Tax=Candidatus Binatus sp. TaxID=2811406 RepID=UPI00271FDB27|nr:nuclear transport factor 2 family protein [Candidatus Binatus sp.]MDO8431968.1 nuclear transport factor 2 family protein [Candidatus Binatus sp.]